MQKNKSLRVKNWEPGFVHLEYTIDSKLNKQGNDSESGCNCKTTKKNLEREINKLTPVHV